MGLFSIQLRPDAAHGRFCHPDFDSAGGAAWAGWIGGVSAPAPSGRLASGPPLTPRSGKTLIRAKRSRPVPPIRDLQRQRSPESLEHQNRRSIGTHSDSVKDTEPAAANIQTSREPTIADSSSTRSIRTTRSLWGAIAPFGLGHDRHAHHSAHRIAPPSPQCGTLRRATDAASGTALPRHAHDTRATSSCTSCTTCAHTTHRSAVPKPVDPPPFRPHEAPDQITRDRPDLSHRVSAFPFSLSTSKGLPEVPGIKPPAGKSTGFSHRYRFLRPVGPAFRIRPASDLASSFPSTSSHQASTNHQPILRHHAPSPRNARRQTTWRRRSPRQRNPSALLSASILIPRRPGPPRSTRLRSRSSIPDTGTVESCPILPIRQIPMEPDARGSECLGALPAVRIRHPGRPCHPSWHRQPVTRPSLGPSAKARIRAARENLPASIRYCRDGALNRRPCRV